MIQHALDLLRLELNAFFKSLPNHPDDSYVKLGNVAALESGTGGETEDLNDQIILSLVNIEEESTFKNLPNYAKTTNGTVQYLNAPIYLNLYLLFSANLTVKKYPIALQYLSEVIQFFQGRNVFNFKTATNYKSNEPLDPDLAELQLILNLYTMTFEQINHLWGSLGGKQLPSVMYKARLIKITDRRTTGTVSVIEEIGTGEKFLE